jgi:hypothetical protein
LIFLFLECDGVLKFVVPLIIGFPFTSLSGLGGCVVGWGVRLVGVCGWLGCVRGSDICFGDFVMMDRRMVARCFAAWFLGFSR